MSEEKPRAMAAMYGVINGLMCTPVAISFCSIIFRDPAFADYMPLLVKLVLFSSAIHQLSFSLFSSLPFAIGQVQDAGLIFLSGIAGSVVQSCQKQGNTEAIIPTTLYTLAICTAALGLLLIATAKLRLATLVQYLPMPVIGGYLAYIGFFCGEAGLAMMADVQIESKSDWVKLFDPDAITLLAPGLACGIAIYVSLRSMRSPFVLPACMAGMLCGFYLIMATGGYSFAEMRDLGWVAPLSPSVSAIDSFRLYDISQVEWGLLPAQIVPMLVMFLVVAFSSSLDIAAIEMELGLPLDYNRELQAVGISNVCSGMLGGYTGSYIFSQTIFTLKRGVAHRLCGVVVAVLELAVVAMPISITSYIPKLFFGSLLVFIATDLMYEWLYEARHKMMNYEYGICITTFIAIQATNIEIGLLIGIAAAMTMFAIIYSKMTASSIVSMRTSSVIRNFNDRTILIANVGKVITISLNGYIFFGSAAKVLDEITSKIELRRVSNAKVAPSHEEITNPTHVRVATAHDDVEGGSTPGASFGQVEMSLMHGSDVVHGAQNFQTALYRMSNAQILRRYEQYHQITAVASGDDDSERRRRRRRRRRSISDQSAALSDQSESDSDIELASVSNGSDDCSSAVEVGEADRELSTELVGAASTSDYLVLDFSKVLGVDATAARSCFRSLMNITKELAVTVVFAQMPDHVEALLRAHDVIDGASVVIRHVDDALEWCENQVLLSCKGKGSADPKAYAEAHLHRQKAMAFKEPEEATWTEDCNEALQHAHLLRDILNDYVEFPRGHAAAQLPMESLVRYFVRERFGEHHVLFDLGHPSDKIFFIESGTVELVATSTEKTPSEMRVLLGRTNAHQYSALADDDGGLDHPADSTIKVVRLYKACAGGVIGETDFILKRQHSVRAASMSEVTCWTLSRTSFVEMSAQHPGFCVHIQQALLKSLAIAATYTTFALHPSVNADVSQRIGQSQT